MPGPAGPDHRRGRRPEFQRVAAGDAGPDRAGRGRAVPARTTARRRPAGMFDRETSPHVTLHPKLTTFDVSALPEDGPSTAMVMVVANSWLMGMLTHDPGVRTNFIAEEGWHLLAGPGGRIIRSKSKLARGFGLAWSPRSTTSPTSRRVGGHRDDQGSADHPPVPAGTRRRHRRLRPVLQPRTVQRRRPGTLPQGDHLLKIGTHKEIRVQHGRTHRETAFTATDSAMLLPPTSGGKAAASAPVRQTDLQLGRSQQRLPLLTGGQLTALLVVAAIAGLTLAWHLALVLTAGSRSPGSASPSAACSPRPRWPCRPYHPAGGATLAVFAVLFAAASPGSAGSPRSTGRHRDSAGGSRRRNQARRVRRGNPGPGQGRWSRRASITARVSTPTPRPCPRSGLLRHHHPRRGTGGAHPGGPGRDHRRHRRRENPLPDDRRLPGRPRPADRHPHETGGAGRHRGGPHRQGPGLGVRPAGRGELAGTDDLEPRHRRRGPDRRRSPAARPSPAASRRRQRQGRTRSSGPAGDHHGPAAARRRPHRPTHGRGGVLGVGPGTAATARDILDRPPARGTVLGADPAHRQRGRRRHPVLRPDDPRAEGRTDPEPHRDAADAPRPRGGGVRPGRRSCVHGHPGVDHRRPGADQRRPADHDAAQRGPRRRQSTPPGPRPAGWTRRCGSSATRSPTSPRSRSCPGTCPTPAASGSNGSPRSSPSRRSSPAGARTTAGRSWPT